MAKRKTSTFERLSDGRLNRKQRRELERRLASEDPGLRSVHPNAGGIDVGNESHFAAVPADRDVQSGAGVRLLDGGPATHGTVAEIVPY